MIKFWTLFKHDLYNLISSPGTLSVFLIFPTILILLMGFLFDNLYHTTIISSYDFYGVTMIFFIAMMGATVPANAFLEKHIKTEIPESFTALYLACRSTAQRFSHVFYSWHLP